MPDPSPPNFLRRFPVATAAVLALAAAVTAAAYADPRLVSLLDRQAGALAAGQWWRPLTALFLHPEGTTQVVFDFLGLALVGTAAEQAYGSLRWLVLFLLPGIAAHLIGFAWQPGSAGSSVGTAGLLGALSVWVASRPAPFPLPPRVGAALAIPFGIGLAVARDIHGPPILVGAALGALFLWRGGALAASRGTA